MSVEAIARALPRRGLTPTQKLILIGIANHDGDGGAWPSVATLADYAECSTRQVQRAVADLAKLGLVERIENGGGDRSTSKHTRPNLYRLHLSTGVTPRSPGDTQVTPPGDTQVTPPLTPMSPEPSFNHPLNPPAAQEPSTSARAEGEEGLFHKFYAKYPNKQKPRDAERAFRAALKRDPVDTVSHGCHQWRSHWATTGTPKDKIPYPAAFLNSGQYLEPPPTSRPTSGPDPNAWMTQRTPVEPGRIWPASFHEADLPEDQWTGGRSE